MKYRVTESAYLALSAARTAIAHDIPVDNRDVRTLIGIIDSCGIANRSRGELLARICAWWTKIVDEGHWEDLPAAVRQEMVDLHQEAIPLSVDSLGLNREAWGEGR